MFERFLHAAPKPKAPVAAPQPQPQINPVPAVSAQTPQASVPEVPESVSQSPQAQEPLQEVRPEPMTDAINPSAKPPMSYNSGQKMNVSSAQVVPDLPDEEEDPEAALPVDEEPVTTPVPDPPSFLKSDEKSAQKSEVERAAEKIVSDAQTDQEILASNEKKSDVVRGESLHTVDFADIWFTPEGIAYVRDKETRFALIPIETADLDDFHAALEQGFTGQSSYAVKFAGDSYRVERVMTNDGVQFNCRKMPTSTPEIEDLGFAPPIVKH